MERRPYFLLGDALATFFAGAAIATVAGMSTPASWGLLPGMLVGMAIGMILAVPIAFLFVPFFGAIEVMMPVMLTGMLAGMAGGMQSAGTGPSGMRLVFLGAAIGFGSLLFTYALNAAIGGEDRRWIS